MKLKKVIKDIPGIIVKGSKEVEITGVCASSKLVAPGNLFIAKKGRMHDGHHYISEAIAAGAAVILTDIYDPTLKNIVQLLHPNAAQVEGLIAAQYHQNPSHELFMVGITGTNGKTTTSMCVKHLLDSLGMPSGLIGTIEYIIGSYRYEGQRTTPDVCSNHKLLREMVRQGCRAAVMEVTSHALHQNRVDNIAFDVAIFTNLTPEHLDYHQTMEEYAKAKNLLFRSLSKQSQKSSISSPPIAIVNADSAWHKEMTAGCPARILTYSIDKPSDLQATDIRFNAEGTQFRLCYGGLTVDFHSPMAGRFNVYNCLSALAVGIARGYSLVDLQPHLATFPRVSGRLERIPNTKGLHIYVDYAHTEEALRSVLLCLKEVAKGRLICVFGCGGDRDKHKRPRMASVSEQIADITIVTSDNPRSETPESICNEIAGGFRHPNRHHIELDRKRAIAHAIQLAQPDDILLIAGKGHETRQVFAHQTIDFDDRLVAADLCHQFFNAPCEATTP